MIMKLVKLKKWLPRLLWVSGVALLVFLVFSGDTTLFNQASNKKPAKVDNQTETPNYTREELLLETNEERVKAGVPTLASDSVLDGTAQQKCDEMAAKNEFEHGDLKSVADKIRRRISENITYGSAPTADAVVWNWVDSPPHYAALINGEWTRVGFGICSFRDGRLVVQHFSGEPTSQNTQSATTKKVYFNPYEYSVDSVEYPDMDFDFSYPSRSTYKPYVPDTPDIHWEDKPNNCHTVLNC